MRRLLPLLLACLCLTPSAYSQMGIARGIAQQPSAPTSPCQAGAVRFARSTNLAYLCGPNNTWTSLATGGSAVGGSGTANQFAIFTAGTTIGNSILTQGTNLISQVNGANPQTLYVYETTASTGSVFQVQALSSATTVRIGSKALAIGAASRAFEFGHEQRDGTFLGWTVGTGGNLNPSSSVPNAEIGNVLPPKSLYLGSVGNGTGFIKLTGITAGTITLTVPASSTTHTLTLPSATGSGVLTNDGAGALSWAAAGGGTAPIIQASSKVPVTSGMVFPNVHVSAGSGAKYFDGLGVADATTLTSDAIWALQYDMPPALPTGTAKLRLRCIANATSGAMKYNVKHAACATETDCSGLTLTASGTTTITWASGDNDQFKESDTTLSDVTADQIELVNLTFEDSGYTLAVTATCKAYIVFIP